MKHYVIVLLFLISMVSACSTNKVVTSKLFHELKTDSINQKFSKILIIGMGSTSSRIFLDKMSSQLIDKFQNAHVKAVYQYFGKDVVEATMTFNSFEKSDFDAFLVFNPKDSSFFGTLASRGSPYVFSSGVSNNTSNNYSLIYHQDFYLQLYSSFNKQQSVWAGLLNANCDLKSMGIYKHLSRVIISHFKKNKYI